MARTQQNGGEKVLRDPARHVLFRCSHVSRGTNSKLRRRLIGVRWVPPHLRRRPEVVAWEKVSNEIDRQTIEGQDGSVMKLVHRNRTRIRDENNQR